MLLSFAPTLLFFNPTLLFAARVSRNNSGPLRVYYLFWVCNKANLLQVSPKPTIDSRKGVKQHEKYYPYRSSAICFVSLACNRG